MELRQLRYVLAIAEHGSLSLAAEKVFIAQSALSHQLAQLEAELGASLFLRTRKGVEPTEAGRRFLAHALALLRQVEDAKASVRQTQDEPAGMVSFGIPHSVSSAFALPLLQAVRRQFPKVELQLTEELTGTLTQQLRTGTLHLAILMNEGPASEFLVRPLVRERMYLISPTSFRVGRSITLQRALTLPLILPANPHGVRPIIEAAARARGLEPPHVVTDISSISILRTTLLAGLGHTLLPIMPLKAEVDAGLLQATPVVSPVLDRALCLCASRHIPLSTAAQAVASLATTVAHALTADGTWQGASAAPLAGSD